MTAKSPNEKPAGATRPEAPAAPPPLAVKSWATRLKELLPNITRHGEAEGDMEGFFTGLERDKQVQAEIVRMEAVKAAEAKYLNRWVMIKGDTFPQDFPMYVTKVYATDGTDAVTLNPFKILLDGQKGRTDAEEVLFAQPVYGMPIYRVSSKSPYTVDGLVKFLASEERKGANRAKSNTVRESKQKIRLMAEQIMIRRCANTPGCGVSRRDALDALTQAERIVEMLNQAEENQPQEVFEETVSVSKREAISEAVREHRGNLPEPLDELMLKAGAERVMFGNGGEPEQYVEVPQCAGDSKVFDPDTADNGLPYGIERITRGEA